MKSFAGNKVAVDYTDLSEKGTSAVLSKISVQILKGFLTIKNSNFFNVAMPIAYCYIFVMCIVYCYNFAMSRLRPYDSGPGPLSATRNSNDETKKRSSAYVKNKLKDICDDDMSMCSVETGDDCDEEKNASKKRGP